MVDGTKIRNLRETLNLNTLEFADAVQISQTQLVHVETGVKQPSAALLKRIADFLKVSVDDLYKKEAV